MGRTRQSRPVAAALERHLPDALGRNAAGAGGRLPHGRRIAVGAGREQRDHRRHRLARRRHQSQYSRHRDARDDRRARRPPIRLRFPGRLQLPNVAGHGAAKHRRDLWFGWQRLARRRRDRRRRRFPDDQPTPDTRIRSSRVTAHSTGSRLEPQVHRHDRTSSGTRSTSASPGSTAVQQFVSSAIPARRSTRRRQSAPASYQLYLVDSNASARDRARSNCVITSARSRRHGDQHERIVLGEQDRKRRRRLPAVSRGTRVRHISGLKNKPLDRSRVPRARSRSLNQFGVPGGTGSTASPTAAFRAKRPSSGRTTMRASTAPASPGRRSTSTTSTSCSSRPPNDGKQDFRLDMLREPLSRHDRPHVPTAATARWRVSSRRGATRRLSKAGAILSDDTYTGPEQPVRRRVRLPQLVLRVLAQFRPTGNPNIADPTSSCVTSISRSGRRSRCYGTSYLETVDGDEDGAAPRPAPRGRLHAQRQQRIPARGGRDVDGAGRQQVDVTYVESPVGGAGGGKPINCSTFNSIGSAPSTTLQPERGVDTELSYAHRWSRRLDDATRTLQRQRLR